MDIDGFIARNAPFWDRLDGLLGKAGAGARRLAPDELDLLVEGYQRVSVDLSYARTNFRDEALVARLTSLAARSGALVHGTRPATLRAAARFVSDTFPAALRTARVAVLASALLLGLPALAVGAWLAADAEVLETIAPEAIREAYVNEDFAEYYRELPSAQFGALVATNNIRVGLLAFAAGIAFCVPTAALLAFNGANIGVAGSLFVVAGQAGTFFALILPHGLLELTAVVIAGAAGLRLGWALIAPGDRLRATAVAQEGRRAVVLLIGLLAVFGLAGIIEGWVTASALPTWAQLAIGICAEAAFVAYAVVRGRAAGRLGLTGALGEERPTV